MLMYTREELFFYMDVEIFIPILSGFELIIPFQESSPAKS